MKGHGFWETTKELERRWHLLEIWVESRLVEGSEEASAKLTSRGSRNFDLIGRMPRCPQADQPEGNSLGKKSWLEGCVSLSQDRTASSHSTVMTLRVQ